MSILPVYILDKDLAVGEWVRNHLKEIGIEAYWVSTVADLLDHSDVQPPTVCLVALRPPVGQALSLIRELTQEPRFATTSFILMGPDQHKRASFEAGADDYLTTPPEVIELRKRVWLYLDRAKLEARLVAEVNLIQDVGAAATDSSTENQPISNSAIAIEQVASLIQEKRWLEMILEHAGDAIAFVEPNGTVRYANPVWEQMTETTAGDTIPWPPGRDNPLVHQAIVAAIRLGHIWRGELHHTNSGGRSVDVELCITPAHDDNHRIIGYVVTQQDVAERKALENLKMRFLSDAGLELRTPVTNLKVRQYLLKQAPPDQHSMHLQALERETERLSYLVDAMLELSRMDLGLVTMTHDTTELNRLVSDVVVRYTPSAENKGVTLAFAPDDALPSIPLDQTHISRAVGILVDNAILYTPEGGHIDVRLNRETWTGGEFVIIQVKDNGIGIEPDAVPHIFERFYRSERVRDSGIRGVGLSLAIAHEIISRHNGDITVESRVNQGSIFTIWLPLKSFD